MYMDHIFSSISMDFDCLGPTHRNSKGEVMVAVNWGCLFVNDVDWIGDLSSSKHPSTIVTLSSFDLFSRTHNMWIVWLAEYIIYKHAFNQNSILLN